MQYTGKAIVRHKEAIIEQHKTYTGYEQLRGACQLNPIAQSQTPHVPKLIVLRNIHQVRMQQQPRTAVRRIECALCQPVTSTENAVGLTVSSAAEFLLPLAKQDAIWTHGRGDPAQCMGCSRRLHQA
jgi:hypothetical protein